MSSSDRTGLRSLRYPGCVTAALVLALTFTSVAFAQKQSKKPPAKNLYTDSDSPTQTFAGMITDSYCGARHDKNLNRTSTDCARFCVHNGAKYALIDGEKTYQLQGNVMGIQRFAGQRARITGQLNGDAISVASIRAEQ